MIEFVGLRDGEKTGEMLFLDDTIIIF